MLHITFKYADEMSGWEWRVRHCVVSSVEECISIYGLNEPGVWYEIVNVEEVKE